MPETIRNRYTGQVLTGGFVLFDDADLDPEDNECPICGSTGSEPCTEESGGDLGPWVHQQREK